jgi:hypothetical protein
LKAQSDWLERQGAAGFEKRLVTRVIAGTIEERILKLQDKKQAVFEGTVGRDAEALGRLTEDDLRFLFGESGGFCCWCWGVETGQSRKQAMFEGTVGRDAEALGRLTEDNLRFLFG